MLIALLLAIAFHRTDQNIKIGIKDISILIPFRNEVDILSQLEFLKSNIYRSGIQVFWVDDFSDHLSSSFKSEIEKNKNFHLLSREPGNRGKKMAISYGMSKLYSDWVILMDADSRPDLRFLKRQYLELNSNWKMILIPIHADRAKGLFKNLFNLEFLVLQVVTHASALMHRPLLANGAAMMVHRKAYLETEQNRNDFHLQSGDDIFSMFAIIEQYGRKSIGSGNTIFKPFSVMFPDSVGALWKQRLRWVSKVGRVPNAWYLFISATVFIANLFFAWFLVQILLGTEDIRISGSVLVYFFVASVFQIFSLLQMQRTKLLPYVIPSIIIYPFYLSALLFASFFIKSNWK